MGRDPYDGERMPASRGTHSLSSAERGIRQRKKASEQRGALVGGDMTEGVRGAHVLSTEEEGARHDSKRKSVNEGHSRSVREG